MNTKWELLCLLIIVSVDIEAKSLPKKVCVIGAGPAGLGSLKQLSEWPEYFDPIAFERNSRIGGQWAYTDNTGIDEHGLPIHSAVYKYLRTTLPKQLQHFPDYEELHGENRSFVKHETILEYLKNYTQYFDLQKYIQLDTLVENVIPIRQTEWVIKTRDLNVGQSKEFLCDVVMICSGSFHKPNIPHIPGIETFPGTVIHSHKYRYPEEYANQTVIILGIGSSGADIAHELSSYAKTVYLSHRHDKVQYELPSNMIEVPGVIAANDKEFILSNGSRITADSIIFCTGYLYDYPFLDASVGIVVDEGRYVHPLYKHLIHVERPTMAFIALARTGLPFMTIYAQAHYFTSVLRGDVSLPDEVEMFNDSKLRPGIPLSKAHNMLLEPIVYYNQIAEITDLKPLPAYYNETFWVYIDQIRRNKLHYRDYEYVNSDDGHVEIVPIT